MATRSRECAGPAHRSCDSFGKAELPRSRWIAIRNEHLLSPILIHRIRECPTPASEVAGGCLSYRLRNPGHLSAGNVEKRDVVHTAFLIGADKERSAILRYG